MNDLLNFILKYLPLLTAIAFPVLIIFVSFYIIYRSGNTGIIATKIWGIFLGEKTYSDPDLKIKEQEENDIAKFNFKTNLRMKSIIQIKTFYELIERYNIEVYLFKGLRTYYVPELKKVKNPSKKDIINMFSLFIPTCFLFLPAFITAFIALPEITTQTFQFKLLCIYTFFITFVAIGTFGELIRMLRAKKLRKVIYEKIMVYRYNR